MATLHLESYDGRTPSLPDVCMKCGMPATLRKSKTFYWFPPWIWILLFVCGLLPFAIVAFILTRRRSLDVPLCEEHKNHWMWRQIIVVGSLIVLLTIGFAAMAADNQGRNPFSGLLCCGSLSGLLIWLIAAINLHFTAIHPREITDSSITLRGVSETFIEAYEGEWHVSPDRLDELARERWKQGSRRPRAVGPPVEDSDRIQRPDEGEGRRTPPDAFQEGTP